MNFIIIKGDPCFYGRSQPVVPMTQGAGVELVGNTASTPADLRNG